MHIELAYGRSNLIVNLPDTADVLRPRFAPGLADEAAGIRAALRHPIGAAPLADLVKAGDTAVIVHTDITRATPNDRILPVILTELEAAGVSYDDVILLNGLGTHRSQTLAELRQMLGDAIIDKYRCQQHDCHDDANLVPLAPTPLGNSVRINRFYLEADVRILTGFIEPHFFAGFSGGPKAVMPALSGAESVFSNHGHSMIAHPQAAWGITSGNPIWEEMLAVARQTNPTFLLNVTLNAEQAISGVFGGDMLAAHEKGCEFVKDNAMIGVEKPYDIVITTNSGYPLDQNLYQTVKGMSAANQIVRRGGAIIMVAACEDGLPEHGRYAALLAEGGSPEGVIKMIAQPGFSAQDQWQVQIQAQIQRRADVFVYSDGLTDEQITQALFNPCRNITETISELQSKYGRHARICVIPEGPQTIPYLHTPSALS